MKDLRPAGQVVSYLERSGMIATKLHFPGNMGNDDSMSLKDIVSSLSAVRKACGEEAILAWDPYPRKAESLPPSVEEAKEMIHAHLVMA